MCWTCVTQRYPIHLPKHFENKPICWQDQGALHPNSTPYLQFIYVSHKWNKPSGILDWSHNQADEIRPSYNISGSRFCIFNELQKFILPLLAARWLNNDKCNLFSTILYETVEYVNILVLPNALTSSPLKPVIIVFLKTCLKEMGGTLHKACKVEKKLAHQKQVLMEEHGQNSSSKRMKFLGWTSEFRIFSKLYRNYHIVMLHL